MLLCIKKHLEFTSLIRCNWKYDFTFELHISSRFDCLTSNTLHISSLILYKTGFTLPGTLWFLEFISKPKHWSSAGWRWIDWSSCWCSCSMDDEKKILHWTDNYLLKYLLVNDTAHLYFPHSKTKTENLKISNYITMVMLWLPGLAFVQATHFVSSALFSTKHVPHSHAPSAFLNLSPIPMNPVETGAVGVDTVLTAEKAEGRVSEGLSPVPGLAVSQATHFTASGLLRTRHVSQSQVPTGWENIVPKPVVVVVVEVAFVLLSIPTEVVGEGLLSIDFDEDLGCGVPQQTHFASDGLFGTKQTSQVQLSGMISPNPVDEERGVVVVEEEEVAVDSVEVCSGEVSEPEEGCATGQAKPGENRRRIKICRFSFATMQKHKVCRWCVSDSNQELWEDPARCPASGPWRV